MPSTTLTPRPGAPAHWSLGTGLRHLRSLVGAWHHLRDRKLSIELDDHLLRDLGFRPDRRVSGAPLGWAVSARTDMTGLVFLGR
jgi:hypothetical protein